MRCQSFPESFTRAFAVLTIAFLGVSALRADPAADVSFTAGPATAPISAAVTIPPGRTLFYTSGTVPPVVNESAGAGTPERYGDTRTQGMGTLKKIEGLLHDAGLGLKDVVYLRVYVVADKVHGGKCDFAGWFDAYGQFFGTKDNPVKPARSTMGVAALVNPDLLIEIEAVAVYPAGATPPPPAPPVKKEGPSPAPSPSPGVGKKADGSPAIVTSPSPASARKAGSPAPASPAAKSSVTPSPGPSPKGQ